MKFQKTPNKFLGKWRYQAQFEHKNNIKAIQEWFSGRFTGDYQIAGDSFYTNELQDVFAVRVQFDNQLKAVRQAEQL